MSLPHNVWFDGDWSAPQLTDERITGWFVRHYAGMMSAGPINVQSLDWPDASLLFQQGLAGFFIDASLFGPGFEDAEASAVAGKTGYAVMPPVDAGRRKLDGPLDVGHRHPGQRAESGRGLVLHPVDDQPGHRAGDRRLPWRRGARLHLGQSRICRRAEPALCGHRAGSHADLAHDGSSSAKAGANTRWSSWDAIQDMYGGMGRRPMPPPKPSNASWTWTGSDCPHRLTPLAPPVGSGGGLTHGNKPNPS